MERFKLHIEAESRIRWKVYVRFGGEFSETDHSNMARRWLLSLHYKFPDLSEIAYNHLLKHKEHYKVRPEFYVINLMIRGAATAVILSIPSSWRIFPMLMKVPTR